MRLFHHLFTAAPIAAAAMLSACNSQPETIVAGGPDDPDAKNVASAPPVELPPMVASSRSYRCKDNSLLYVDFMSDSKTANLRTKKDGSPTKLISAEAGKPFAGEGYSVSGTGADVEITQPGKGAQSCKA
jgi:hypothetical protein